MKHEKKEMKMAKHAQKHVAALRKIADGLESMHKGPTIAVMVKTKVKPKKK